MKMSPNSQNSAICVIILQENVGDVVKVSFKSQISASVPYFVPAVTLHISPLRLKPGVWLWHGR